jgi:hypothetical protein
MKNLFPNCRRQKLGQGFSILENLVWVFLSRSPELDDVSHFYQLENP